MMLLLLMLLLLLLMMIIIMMTTTTTITTTMKPKKRPLNDVLYRVVLLFNILSYYHISLVRTSYTLKFHIVFTCLVLACPVDRYGIRCNETCPMCDNFAVCHPINGSCICSPGFHGPLCKEGKLKIKTIYSILFLF